VSLLKYRVKLSRVPTEAKSMNNEINAVGVTRRTDKGFRISLNVSDGVNAIMAI